MPASSPILDISGLSVSFSGHGRTRRVVDNVSIMVNPRGIVAVIGESGSGKTITALAVLGLLPRNARIERGRITLNGRSLTELTPAERRHVLGDRMAYIPQDALRALNPTIRVGDQVGEPFVIHRSSTWAAARKRAAALLGSVHLPEPDQRALQYPHEFSGGMQQRAMIAMGLALEPELLIADEPTTALDVTVQAQVLKLLKEIRDEHGTSILFITHDLGLVTDFCDQVYVMYAGRVVEYGPVDRIFEAPRHPYTAALLAATPSAAERLQTLDAIPGQIPQPGQLPRGCVFRPRCPRAESVCQEDPPFKATNGSGARCWFAGEA
ncbi:MAG: ABC transporter ATP-binding protein [Hyphomicrobiales bacterium]